MTTSSSSPLIRTQPQPGFSRAILKISCRTVTSSRGRTTPRRRPKAAHFRRTKLAVPAQDCLRLDHPPNPGCATKRWKAAKIIRPAAVSWGRLISAQDSKLMPQQKLLSLRIAGPKPNVNEVPQ